MSTLIAIDGLDGSGKGTQTNMLVDRLKIDGYAVRTLSFPMYERDDEIELFEDELAPFGDIVLSVPHAQAQAKEYGHSVEREVCYLIVHGLMHLAGYDHIEEDDKVEMRAAEEALLNAVGVTRA